MKDIAKWRSDAAMILQIAASNPETCGCTYDAEWQLLDARDTMAGAVAREALYSVKPFIPNPTQYAEAECLLRTGWSPT